MTSSRDLVLSSISKTLNIPKESIHDDINLSELTHDSIKLFELFLQLEEFLDMTFEFEDIEHVKTVGSVIEFIDSLLKKNSTKN